MRASVVLSCLLSSYVFASAKIDGPTWSDLCLQQGHSQQECSQMASQSVNQILGSSNYCSQMPAPSFVPSAQPWWAPWGAATYQNFYQPAAWAQNGVNGSTYPGTGSMMVGKPNIYISGREATKFSVHLKLPAHATLLAAVPEPADENSWSGEFDPKSGLHIGEANYPYLYYDFRTGHELFQHEEGFCASTSKELMAKMTDALKRTGFANNEIQDFQEYWSVKLPESREYCVFPQTERELAHIAPLAIQPTPRNLRRLWFVVTLAEGRKAGYPLASSFVRKPKKEWSPNSLPPNDEAGIDVHEWGIAFIQASP